jgi:phosphoesterase RecJ-like protein
MYWGLKSLGKQVTITLQDEVPFLYDFLSGVDKIQPLEKIQSNSVVIFLDCSDKYRAGDDFPDQITETRLTVNIDHHPSNDFFADYNYVDDTSVATAELVYRILVALDVKITVDMAEAIYTGIVMDSGNFLYNNTSPRTMRIAADLLECGTDIEKIRTNLFESKPRAEVLLLRKGLKNLEFDSTGRMAWMTLSAQEVEAAGATGIHPEGIINYTRSIKGVEIGMLFRETSPGMVKVGFRSKGSLDVAELALKLGGGGHQQAAGAHVKGSLAEVKAQVLGMAKDVLD